SGDFNGDGIEDLAVLRHDPTYASLPPAVAILLGAGDGTFRPAVQLAVKGGSGLVAADFNGDGFTDLVLDDGEEFLGNGDGTFRPVDSGLLGSGSDLPGNQLVVGDFNGDTVPDLAFVDGYSV